MSQLNTIKEILLDGQRHCSAEFVEKMFIIDYRRRICDLKTELTILSEPCRGRCGRNHKANMHWYWISNPKQETLC